MQDDMRAQQASQSFRRAAPGLLKTASSRSSYSSSTHSNKQTLLAFEMVIQRTTTYLYVEGKLAHADPSETTLDKQLQCLVTDLLKARELHLAGAWQ